VEVAEIAARQPQKKRVSFHILTDPKQLGGHKNLHSPITIKKKSDFRLKISQFPANASGN
jgi:hypothetical protein